MDEGKNLKELVLSDYEKGFSLTYIALVNGIEVEDILSTLKDYKEESSLKNGLTTEFKKLIAKRDIHDGVSRISISRELGVNSNTVKKACEKYGRALKESGGNGQEHTKIEGNFVKTVCPSCSSKKVNQVDKDTIFCKQCGDEHIFKEGYVLRINFEFFDE